MPPGFFLAFPTAVTVSYSGADVKTPCGTRSISLRIVEIEMIIFVILE